MGFCEVEGGGEEIGLEGESRRGLLESGEMPLMESLKFSVWKWRVEAETKQRNGGREPLGFAREMPLMESLKLSDQSCSTLQQASCSFTLEILPLSCSGSNLH
ncbi:hypothetical protein Patl1_12161 [Pistacia atlantica]|uniref:Uncharacterized protein n=1 Tax=Pistacia atlantica TaxID=434234 RepID=A0ACC1A589_9ROSI|nr:hypothetical protein Patl1_12161 [Pistacia atlantica]